MEMVYRFRIKPGKAGAFVAWDKAQREADTPTAEGWSYKGTWMVVQGLGDYDAESRFHLDDYAALGSQQPPEAMEPTWSSSPSTSTTAFLCGRH